MDAMVATGIPEWKRFSTYENIRHIGSRLSDHEFPAAYIGKWHWDAGDYLWNGICPAGWSVAHWYDMRNYLEELPEEARLRSRQAGTMHNGAGIQPGDTFGSRCTDCGTAPARQREDAEYQPLGLDYDTGQPLYTGGS